jgi:purine-cytosine permease-like protein
MFFTWEREVGLMFYLAGVFVAVAVALGVSDLLWLTPGAGALVGVALVAAIGCLCIQGVWLLIRHRREEHRPTRI